MQRVAVIGSNSFSGSDFVDLLLEDESREVLGISRSPEKSATFLPYKRHGPKRFRFLQADLNHDLDRILSSIDAFRPDAIINFAAQSEVAPSWAHPEHWFQTNGVAIAALGNALKDRTWLKRYVHISSPEVYGTTVGTITEDSPVNPSTPYAASKAAGDMFLSTVAKNFPFPLVSIRATNVYGAHQQLFKIIPRTVISIKSGRTIDLHGGGTAIKSYIHIRDVSRGELAAMEHGRNGEMYHLSPEGGIAVKDVVAAIARRMGKELSEVARPVGERLGQDAAYVIDSSKARKEFGWRPTISLDEGIAGVVSWVESEWDQISKLPLEYHHKP